MILLTIITSWDLTVNCYLKNKSVQENLINIIIQTRFFHYDYVQVFDGANF